MEVEFVTDEISEDENYGFDDNNEDYLSFEGERCGICMDIVIDRGVIDCCQHWFCFACIDNWATITSLCPLCQNEFQLITCVPVHDIIGGNKTDDDIDPRDDDWFIEGENNTLSFPSYYINENAVVCLDGDGCKIRSGSVAIEEDSDIDTSIACDSCDKWYHAFCVGFDTEGTCEGSWLCPRCNIDKCPQKSDRFSILKESYQNGFEITGGDCRAKTSFSERVSVSVADDGETAVVISLVEGNKEHQESRESVSGCSKDMENMLCTFISNNSEALPGNRNCVEPNSCQQQMELSLSGDNCSSSSHSIVPAELKISADDEVKRTPSHLNNKKIASVLDFDRELSTGSDRKNNLLAEDLVPGSLEPKNTPEGLFPAEKVVPNEMEVLSLKSVIPDENETISGITGAKRKHFGNRNVNGGERDSNTEAKLRKKIKAERNDQAISLADQTDVSVIDDSSTIPSQRNLRDSPLKSKSVKENGTSDIMDIVHGTDRKSLKRLGHKKPSLREGESAAGLRLKKILRRDDEGKDSSVLVQEIRNKIREAVRNKSSNELGQNLFDPKLLEAFRAALAGSGAENRKPTLDVKAKMSLLQKGKVRESLTRKIYGTGGKQRRAWTRECEVEFWKHRCVQASRPEKIQTLKSVLDLLRDNSDNTKRVPTNEEEPKSSILSRLYLADSSVFPRKNDIRPVATLEQKRESGLTEIVSTQPPIDQCDRNPQKHSNISQVIVLPLNGKETKNNVHKKINPKGAPTPSSGGMKKPSDKDMAGKSDVKGDKRQWALELLARKTATAGTNMQEKEEDNAILKGNYTFLAQLPKEMRPVLAPCRHNKIPTLVRQGQLYRLTEHFLKKVNLSVAIKSAETELAVADAVNIEKEVADRSNSKIVYLNLCSQELRSRSDDLNSDRAKEPNPSSNHGTAEEDNHSPLNLEVDEALRNAGLMSDTPPSSPNHPTADIHDKVGSPEITDDEEPDNVFEVDSHQELDIYGDFEYNLEDDDFIGAGALNISKLQRDPPKIKLLFSSLKPEKPNGILDLSVGEVATDVEASAGSSGLIDSENKTDDNGVSTVDCRADDNLVPNSSVDKDEELSLAECEELYGPDKEPITISITPSEQFPVENGGYKSNHTEKNNGKASEDCADTIEAANDGSEQSHSNSQKREDPIKKDKASKNVIKQSEHSSVVMKKVEAYIKEHVRPLCKSGVITVEQYRWAVGKTTEKVMKYHAKERNANFLIKEGEKVKKLAEQYVEAAQQKTNT